MSFKALQPTRVKAVALSDNGQAEQPSGLRVANKSAAWATLKMKAADSRTSVEDVTFDIAPGTVEYIPGRFSHIYMTGSTALSADFVVHGYYDPQND